MKIPFLNFDEMHYPLRSKMIEAFTNFYDRQYYVMGDSLKLFESEYATFSQVNYAIGTSNGLDALFLSLKATGIGPGDEIIIPSNTFIASALAVSFVGARPVFVEPRRDTYNINPDLIEDSITSRTKGIIPVHLYGQSAEMKQIMEIAKHHQLWVIEDNAQAHGSEFNGKITGSWGHINATSFYPGKNLGALGDGGAVTTNFEDLAEKVKSLRNYGSRVKYHNTELGHNMRLDELQSSFLSIKLPFLKEWTQKRRQIASWYSNYLKDLPEIILPEIHPNSDHVYHLFVIRTKKRNSLQEHLNQEGIGTLIHYPIPPHLQEAYSSLGYKKGDFPIAEELAETSLSLPIWPGMTEEMVIQISEKIWEFFEGPN
ncbi:DegT/DnrJ/EryC1/StrS family aminotransferase [Algoriphagus kandeliae]|uniref:DegT/DnrJ/EryC1/StrS family aminotransferase n=1 Tax=Algoriphagus kandeliae TaxID=2562278 RepID=A0A4Y9R0B5_9BACT|nr:DegT/DnrJ/EryC1/StrS family aminotransferase [Algoriphagus kandeliae]TFV97232.1 DegT/DnrJ/EryC1/StrS family aminotransferase [Algoriphagus kandeliae]